MNRVWLMMWQWGDHVYRRIRRFDYEDRSGKNVFRLRIRHYTGPQLPMPSGGEVKQGEWVGFLHFYNLRLQELLHGISSDNRRVLIVAKEVQRSLPELAEFIRSHPYGERIKALIGITLLNRGVEPLGFTVSPVPDTLFFRFKNWYMRLMLAFCHPAGRGRLSQKNGQKKLKLKRVMISAEELFHRYGKISAAAGLDLEQE